LASQGIALIPAEGIFDPAQHEVLAELENADVPKGTILEVHRAGYRCGDQLVRSAQVIVARPPV
jgi:molecular chaperone GrpE